MHFDDETPTNNDTPEVETKVVPLRREVPVTDRQRSTLLAGVLSLAGVALGFGLGQHTSANSNCARQGVVHRQPATLGAASIATPHAPQARLTWLGVATVSRAGENRGAEISMVVPGSPAERSGLRVGERIVSLGDTAIAGAPELTEQVQLHRAGQAVEVTTSDCSGGTKAREIVLDSISPRQMAKLR